MDNRFAPQELTPGNRSYIIREQDGERAWDVMQWDVLGGGAKWKMTNVRNLGSSPMAQAGREAREQVHHPADGICGMDAGEA